MERKPENTTDDVRKLKELFLLWEKLSDRGRVLLLTYGQGMADMEAMTRAVSTAKQSDRR